MIAKEMIADGILPLKTSDTGFDAMSWMEEYRVLHMPIVNHRQLLGLISEFDIHELADLDEPLGNVKLNQTGASVYDHQHIFDVMTVFYEFNLTLCPVVDEKNNYMGCITLQQLLKRLTSDSSLLNPGSIIILEMDQNSYSLGEISQIVESNDTKVLAMYVTNPPDSMKLQVTLKVNKVDISGLLQTFNRYDYNIQATFAQKDDLDDIRDRYDEFMKYLNI